MERHKELLKNTAILALGKFATQFLSFLLLPIYARFLDPAEFGIFDLAMTYITLALPFLTIRLEYAAFRFLIDARKNEEEKARIISTTCQFLSWSMAIWVIGYLIINSFVQLQHGYSILALALATTASGAIMQIARGIGSNKGFAIASMIAGMTTSVGSFVLIVVAHWGIQGIFLSAIVGNLLATLYLIGNLKLAKYLKRGHYSKPLSKKLLRFGAPMVPSGLAWWGINGADKTIIALFLDMAANGIYAIANRYSFALIAISNVFGMAWKESASMYINSKDRDKYFSETINKSLKIFGSIGLILTAITPLVFASLFGNKYAGASLYVPILVAASFFNAAVELYAGIYVAKKMSGKLATTNILAAAISITLNLTFIRFIGLYAPAIAMLVAFATMAVWRAYDSRKHVRVRYDKTALYGMGVLYGLICAAYYTGGIEIHIAALALTLAVVYWLNRHELARIQDLVTGKFKKKPINKP